MFTTRLKVVLIVVTLLLVGLFARAVQLQWAEHGHWAELAQRRFEGVEFPETTRGRILDYKGRVLAHDAPCIDVAVDYRVITLPPDEKWVRDHARSRLRARLGHAYLSAPRDQQRQLIEEQMVQVRQDIDAMWRMFGDVGLTGVTAERVEEVRQQILLKVQMQQRYVWYANFARAEKRQAEREQTWWQKWLLEDGSQELELDAFYVPVGEERSAHVVLPAISAELANHFGKNMDRLPGLVLQPGQTRVYPYGEVAAHVIGHLAAVTADDRKKDPDKGNPMRAYSPTDRIGRQGVEALCETVLRGSRGRWVRTAGREAEMDVAAEQGQDVRLSIDIELQKAMEAAFRDRKGDDGQLDPYPLHGAAVLIDVPTGEVRALVSYPTYDLNEMARQYPALLKDEVNRPLLNRATMSQYEPGSTVKPIVGIAGISAGKVQLHEGIECTGYLKLGNTVYHDFARCWTARMGGLAHHASPHSAPHRGKHGNADGFLVMSDSLHRSCNVWPETVADRLGFVALMDWYRQFGLGRATGIGIPEARGRLLDGSVTANRRSATWFAGIGQGIGATPLQMANVAATIARDGTWVRPQLVVSGGGVATTQASQDRVVLPVSAAAMREAREGMVAAVNTPGGTGTILRRDDLTVAGKTGSAQAAAFSVMLRDERGEILRDDKGRRQRRYFEPSRPGMPNVEAPWYRASEKGELEHAWFIGFAPGQRPRLAFAVMVEYGGGGGGKVAGPIARELLDAAMEHGYLAGAR